MHCEGRGLSVPKHKVTADKVEARLFQASHDLSGSLSRGCGSSVG